MLTRKRILYAGCFFTLLLFTACNQQVKKNPEENIVRQIPAIIKDSNLLSIDRSPMDMIYFPVDYPKEKMANPGLQDPLARVIYSRPQKNGRLIFADTSITKNVIQHYNQEWRLGANEATEIEFFKTATINGKRIAPGRYILYCIPSPDKWKIIFNSNLFSWGLHMDKNKDIAETDIPVINNGHPAEYFTMVFQNTANGCNLVMEWGDVKAIMPISFN
ncbi:MAG TPA: DUF2911 domain-containing protein [Ferruginibacter sp.]|nr:DUF2911 domain-containing protein [Ferruginibacter sp.]